MPELIGSSGGRYLARGAAVLPLEGEWPARAFLTIVEFPGLEDARRFFHSEEYRPFAVLRRGRTTSSVVLVAGVDDTAAARTETGGYVLADLVVTDPGVYQEYRRLVPATIEAHGRHFLVRGGEQELLEGDWATSRLVVVEFDSVDAARRWYDSPAYEPLIALRQRASDGRLAIVEGLSPTA